MVETRSAKIDRQTAETDVQLELRLASGELTISTGLPFFDHMVSQLFKHGGMSGMLIAKGDLVVDAHHTVEDVGIVIGKALKEAIGNKAGIKRFSNKLVPLDEALIEVALDISGRPYLSYKVEFVPDVFALGEPPFEPQLAEEFFRALVQEAGITLHIRYVEGKNTHHILEATFKAVAISLKEAVEIEGDSIPSTKGSL